MVQKKVKIKSFQEIFQIKRAILPVNTLDNYVTRSRHTTHTNFEKYQKKYQKKKKKNDNKIPLKKISKLYWAKLPTAGNIIGQMRRFIYALFSIETTDYCTNHFFFNLNFFLLSMTTNTLDVKMNIRMRVVTEHLFNSLPLLFFFSLQKHFYLNHRLWQTKILHFRAHAVGND